MIDVFKIGVHVGMTGNSTQFLGLMLRDLTKANVSVKELNANIGKLRTALIGAGAVFVGGEIVRGIWHMVDGAKELNRELNNTRMLGGDFAKQIGMIHDRAFAVNGSVPTSTPAGNVKMLRELSTQLNSPDAAAAVLPQAQMIAFLAQHYTGKPSDELARDLLKVADLRGQLFTKGADGKEHVDPVKAMAEMQAGLNAIILSGGMLDGKQLLQMARQGGLAAKLQSREAFYATGAELAIQMGAARTGTAETALMQQFVGGMMTTRVAEEMQRIGLLHEGEWRSARGGRIVVTPEATKRLSGIAGDPSAFVTNQLVPMLAAHGLRGNDALMEVFRLFGRQTTQRLISELMQNAPQFDRAREIFGGIPDAKANYNMLMQKDLDANLVALSAAWKGLMDALGEQGIPVAITVLHDMTAVIHDLSAAVEAHPTIAKDLLVFAGSFGVLLSVGGALKIASIALGPFAAGIRLLTGSLAGAEIATATSAAATLGGPAGKIGSLLSVGLALETLVTTAGAVWRQANSMAGDPTKWPKDSPFWRNMPLSTRKKYPNAPQNPDPKPFDWNLNHYAPGHHPFEDDKGNVHNESYIPPSGGGAVIQLTSYTTLDGRVIAKTVSRYQSDALSLPNPGVNRFDPRQTVSHPSDTLGT